MGTNFKLKEKIFIWTWSLRKEEEEGETQEYEGPAGTAGP